MRFQILKSVLIFGAMLAGVVNANAMCSSYKGQSSNKAPIVKICDGMQCENTRQELFCDNANDTQFVYKNGLDISINKNNGRYVVSVIYKGRRIHKEKWSNFTCVEIKGYGDSCFNFSGDLSNLYEN